MQWEKEGSSYVQISKSLTGMSFDRVMFINIDNGLSWSPKGKLLSRPGKGKGWVWAHPDENVVINYINKLYTIEWCDRKGVLPIFFSKSKDRDSQIVCSEMRDDLIIESKDRESYEPTFILGVELEEAVRLMELIFEDEFYGVSFNENFETVSLPFSNPNIESNDLWDIGITPSIILPDPVPYGVAIMIGQPGSGKSSYTRHLKTLGYNIIEEKEAGKIRRRSTKKAIREFIELLQRVKECERECTCKGKCKYYGVVIDSTSPSIDSRNTFKEIIEDEEMDYEFLFISRSGFHLNSLRDQPVPKIALYTYSKKLELPENYTRVL
jgi:hypothetical protein